MKCRVCKEEKELTKGICQEYLENTSRTFELDNIPKAINVLTCPYDGKYLGNHTTNKCPKCNKCYSYKCKKCNEYISSPGSTCNNCGYNPHDDYKIKCVKCGYLIDNPGSVCNSCGYNPHNDYDIKCLKCNSNINNIFSICDNCGYNPNNDFINLCKSCGLRIENKSSTCKSCGYNPHNDYNYTCKKCGYKISGPNVKCDSCGYNPKTYHSILCKKCGSKLSSPGEICKYCGYNPHNDYNYKCLKCGNKINNSFETCKSCGYDPHNNFNYKCIKCNEPKISPNETCRKCGYNLRDSYKWHCVKCKNEISTQWSLCSKCGYKPEGMIKSNFKIIDSITYYKGIKLIDLIKMLDNGEIEIPNGFKKKFGIWTYNNIDILSGDKILLQNKNFQEYKNQEFVLDRSINDYVLWSEFKTQYENNISRVENTNILKSIQNKYSEAKVIPTYITNIDENHKSKRFMEGLGIFQKKLIEDEIGWNAYVKFAINDNKNLIPLTAGKSGSLLVSNGHDLNFSHNIQDGPSRRYLKENNIDWYKEEIIIIPFISEKEALNAELELFQLGIPFGS